MVAIRVRSPDPRVGDRLAGDLLDRAFKRRGDRRQGGMARFDAVTFPSRHRIDVHADRRGQRLLRDLGTLAQAPDAQPDLSGASSRCHYIGLRTFAHDPTLYFS